MSGESVVKIKNIRELVVKYNRIMCILSVYMVFCDTHAMQLQLPVGMKRLAGVVLASGCGLVMARRYQQGGVGQRQDAPGISEFADVTVSRAYELLKQAHKGNGSVDAAFMALQSAIQSDKSVTPEFILRKHPDVLRALQQGLTPSLSYELTQKVNRGVDTDSFSCAIYGHTFLHKAAEDNEVALIEPLVRAGIDVNAREKRYSGTPLRQALMGGHVDAVRELLRLGASVEKMSLHSVWHQGAEMVPLLLEHGAELEAHAGSGCTPLMTAARNGRFDVVQSLLAAGANARAQDYRGKTALKYAMDEGIDTDPGENCCSCIKCRPDGNYAKIVGLLVPYESAKVQLYGCLRHARSEN